MFLIITASREVQRPQGDITAPIRMAKTEVVRIARMKKKQNTGSLVHCRWEYGTATLEKTVAVSLTVMLTGIDPRGVRAYVHTKTRT